MYTLVLKRNSKCVERNVSIKVESPVDAARILKLMVFNGEYKVCELYVDGQPIEPEVLRILVCI